MSNNVDFFIADLQEPQRSWLLQIQQFILNAAPGIQESIKWKVPCYAYKGMLCYLNPKKDHLDFGFMQGIHLSNTHGLLQGDGKMVRHVKIYTDEDLKWELLGEILQEALLFNEMKAKNKSK